MHQNTVMQSFKPGKVYTYAISQNKDIQKLDDVYSHIRMMIDQYVAQL